MRKFRLCEGTMRVFLAISLLLAFPLPTLSQASPGVVHGVVLNSRSGKPIAGVTIGLAGRAFVSRPTTAEGSCYGMYRPATTSSKPSTLASAYVAHRSRYPLVALSTPR